MRNGYCPQRPGQIFEYALIADGERPLKVDSPEWMHAHEAPPQVASEDGGTCPMRHATGGPGRGLCRTGEFIALDGHGRVGTRPSWSALLSPSGYLRD